ncbi:hypothetical protein AN216_03725 [Streptomyces oceani]|uniref:Uncharacterized protein n=1 Tax=Streptomyces oceani TaxID=1075402 RepID=A0A1E7KN41_9ACTN|nr:hypothetical protein AN216_03725 [Streptomyces oceani]
MVAIDHHPGEARTVEFPDGRAWRRVTTTAEAIREDARSDAGAKLDAPRAALDGPGQALPQLYRRVKPPEGRGRS